MARDIIKNVKICGIVCAVPDNEVNTKEYGNKFGNANIDKFIETVGVESRFVSPQPQITTADLCCVAAEELIAKLEVDKASIDGIILVTQHPDYPTCPASACVLQHRLGLDEECLAYDVNQGCAGYVYGMYIAASHMQNGNIKRVLLLAGDAGHRVSEEDKSMAMLFGDAGSATLLEYDECAEDIPFLFRTIGSGFRTIICPAGGSRHREGNSKLTVYEEGIARSDYDGRMDGMDVFNFTIRQVPRLIRDFNEYYQKDLDEYDLYVLHQANKYMLDYLAKKSKLDKSKVPMSISKYGNTSSASIPITLCDYQEGVDSSKELTILAAGFGVGLSLGIMSFQVNSEKCFSVVKTLERFEDNVL